MKYIKTIQEKIYLGKIGLKSYSFKLYDIETGGGLLTIVDENDLQSVYEIRGTGRPLNDKWESLNIFHPDTVTDEYFEDMLESIIYILNKNRLGYKFDMGELVKPDFGLKPYCEVSVRPSINLVELELLLSSTKSVNPMVKKKGGFDQWSF